MNQQWNPQLSVNDERIQILVEWLRIASPFPMIDLQSMTGDASFRRYFRLLTDHGSYVVMDAPPDKEDVVRFMTIANALISFGLNAPHVYAHDISAGFLILSDFGDETYLRALERHPPTPLYQNALRALAVMQHQKTETVLALPHFTHDLMQSEWLLHKEWFLDGLLLLQDYDSLLLNSSYHLLVESALLQPQVFMYRDFHAGNLMLLPNHDVGLLDFQDAFVGPLTYDVASFLRDCYIDWPEEQVIKWALFYYSLLHERGELRGVTEHQFLKWFDWMGIQRHIKALMTFSRKALRDKDAHYLTFVPRTLNYIISVSKQYDELSSITAFYQNIVLPAFKRKYR